MDQTLSRFPSLILNIPIVGYALNAVMQNKIKRWSLDQERQNLLGDLQKARIHDISISTTTMGNIDQHRHNVLHSLKSPYTPENPRILDHDEFTAMNTWAYMARMIVNEDVKATTKGSTWSKVGMKETLIAHNTTMAKCQIAHVSKEFAETPATFSKLQEWSNKLISINHAFNVDPFVDHVSVNKEWLNVAATIRNAATIEGVMVPELSNVMISTNQKLQGPQVKNDITNLDSYTRE